MIYILITFIICIVVFTKMTLVIIPQFETKIIERLGRYHATLCNILRFTKMDIDTKKRVFISAQEYFAIGGSIVL